MQPVAAELTYPGKSSFPRPRTIFFLITCNDERLNEQKRSAKDVITDRQSRLMAVYITRLA